jgi:hypothetical protein
MLAFISLLSAALAGEPILVPDFTPGTTSEFALSYLLQDRVFSALEAAGHVVLTSDVVRPIVGDVIDGCADVPACPAEPIEQLPARLALVVRVERREGAVVSAVRLYDRTAQKYVADELIPIPTGEEDAFGARLVAMVNDRFKTIGPGSTVDLVEAAQLVGARRQAERKPTATAKQPEATAEQPTAAPSAKPPIPTETVGSEGASDPVAMRMAGTELKPKHVRGSTKAFMNSPLSANEWFFKSTPHAGRLTVEVRGGLGVGDVDRAADVRVQIERDGDGNPIVTDEWYQEGPQVQRRPKGALFIGYSPTTWFDFGAVLGLQYGGRTLTTAFTENGTTGDGSTDSGQAVQLDVTPMARFYLVPLGPAKPYLVVGGNLRAFDRYQIAPTTIEYPKPEAGVVFGATGGGGLMVDPGPIVGFFLEGTYTQHFGLRASAAETGALWEQRPPAPNGVRYTVGVVGGVQFRL